MVQLRRHGGLCCGIVHIQGFSHHTTGQRSRITVPPVMQNGLSRQIDIRTDKWGTVVEETIPDESAVQRLDRCLAWCKKYHKYGIVEAVLTVTQAANWETILLERGFKMVSECRNSNSGNRIRVYHLCNDDRPVTNKPSTPQKSLREL